MENEYDKSFSIFNSQFSITLTFFELYELPIRFVLDENALKRKFYQLSKKYHPDFYTLESEEKQKEILELSTLTNEGYQVLWDADKRMKYVLSLKNILDEEGKAKIPQDFLMEMMDVNEALMELEFDFDEAQFSQLKNTLHEKENALYETVRPILENYQDGETPDSELHKIKEFYYKRRYILRIKENLDKFAAH